MNNAHLFWNRLKGRYQRTAANLIARRSLKVILTRPVISFTFDDFPKSALITAGRILEEHGSRGTYYVSLSLKGQIAPTGEMFDAGDIPLLLERGHELGCHTFAHCHASETTPDLFEKSILENQRALDSLVPGARFRSLSYPIGSPRPEIKRRAAKYFLTCRGGGQTTNVGTLDLNNLSAFFLEQSRDRLVTVESLIDETCRERGWLIFATHDVCKDPTRFGCTPDFFKAVVGLARRSGAELLCVSAAAELLGRGAGTQHHFAPDGTRSCEEASLRLPHF